MSLESHFFGSRTKRLRKPLVAFIVASSMLVTADSAEAKEEPFVPQYNSHSIVLDQDQMMQFELDLLTGKSSSILFQAKQGPSPPTESQLTEDIGSYFAKAYEQKIEEDKNKPVPTSQNTVSASSVAKPASTIDYDSLPYLQPCGRDLPPCEVAYQESHGNYDSVNHDGCGGRSCGGKWQFDPKTWNNFGGYEFAQDAPPEVQDEKAREVWDGGAGCGNWSAC